MISHLESRHVFMLFSALLVMTFLPACSRDAPTAPSPAGLSGPASAERRVGAVGGGEGVCIGEEGEDELCPDFWGTFTLHAPNGETLTGHYDNSHDNWLITGGSGRFLSASGFADLAAGVDYVRVLFNFELGGASPAVLTQGVLARVSSAQRSSSECTSGLAVDEIDTGTLESFGRVTLEWSRCVTP